MNETTLAFLRQHAADDPLRLLLQQGRYPDVDMRFVAQQIEGRRYARDKWPELARSEDCWFPPKLNREQSSSEATARFKAERFAAPGMRVADLTGGMGVDSMAFARQGATVDYWELDADLCALMEHNCAVLALGNVRCRQGDSIAWIVRQTEPYDLLFIDPARRDSHGGRVAAFEDCTPNLLEHLDMLLARGRRLLVKASPMADISAALRQLGCVREVHILSLNGECKELLFHCEAAPAEGRQTAAEPIVSCQLLGRKSLAFNFMRSQEAAAEGCYAAKVGSYLFDPDTALMKGGPFKLLCHRFGIALLGRNSHIYTADAPVADFLGRTFRVLSEVALNKKSVAKLLPERKAHVVCRNYPVAAAALQQQLGLKEGGSLFIIATTVGSRPTGLLCERVEC